GLLEAGARVARAAPVVAPDRRRAVGDERGHHATELARVPLVHERRAVGGELFDARYQLGVAIARREAVRLGRLCLHRPRLGDGGVAALDRERLLLAVVDDGRRQRRDRPLPLAQRDGGGLDLGVVVPC